MPLTDYLYCPEVDDVKKEFGNLQIPIDDPNCPTLTGISTDNINCYIEQACAYVLHKLCQVYCHPLQPAIGYEEIPEHSVYLLKIITTKIAACILAEKFFKGDEGNKLFSKTYKYYEEELEALCSCSNHLCGVKICRRANLQARPLISKSTSSKCCPSKDNQPKEFTQLW